MSEKGLEVLLDLKTGMQSNELEIRVQSVLRFINFFEEYPDPLLVNNGVNLVSMISMSILLLSQKCPPTFFPCAPASSDS